MDTYHQKIAEILVKWYGCHNVDSGMVKEIAKISFKVGETQGKQEQYIIDWGHEGEAVKQAKQVGIREVVEWMQRHEVKSYAASPSGVHLVDLGMLDGWQAKLKEWGIE